MPTGPVQRRQIDPPTVFDSQRYGFLQAVATTGGSYIVQSAARDLAPIGDALRRRFAPHALPAAWVVVSGLAGEGLVVEVKASAVIE
ncbi:MAG: hypothetical protein ACRDWX_00435 [Acidimicrobiia bacterium]